MRIPRSIHRFINRLRPYQALLTLVVPLAIVEPLKLVALFVVGGGHFITGVLVMICAYAGSLFIAERLSLSSSRSSWPCRGLRLPGGDRSR